MPYLGNAPAEAYSQISYQDLTGGSGTSFTLDYPAGSAGEIEVFVNNVRQEPTVAYTVSGTSLTMTGSISATDDFYVVFQGKAQQSIGIPEKQTNGDYNFDSNTLFIDSSASSVGVGTASPSVPFQVSSSNGAIARFANNSATLTTSYLTVINANNTSNGTVIAHLSDGTSYIGNQQNNALKLVTNDTERIRIDSDGLKFNGDTAAANALDDYEEGTWTPTSVQGSVTAFSNATYTKIGDTVHLSVSGIRLSDTTTASPIQIGGQPFAISNRAIGAMMIRYAGSTIGHSIYMAGSYMEPTQTLNSGSWNNLQHSDLTSSSCDLYFSITYKTAA